MHSSRLRTARSLTISWWGGGVRDRGGMRDRGVCVVGACMARTPPPTPVDRMTDACKNITLPQTSFAGGKNLYKSSLLRLETSYSNVCII